jgi:hypothetical protein
MVSFVEAVKRGKNSYANSFTSPVMYVRQEKIGFFPQPIGGAANRYIHYYYKQPTPVDSSHDFTLREETHEAILEYTLYLCWAKDADRQTSHLTNFQTIVNNL